MPVKLFLDANVLFSAANENSHLHELIVLLATDHELISSDYALIEAKRNIQTKRPQWSSGVETVLNYIRIVGSVDVPIKVELVEKDRPILATAIHEHCDFLVTGDRRDFGVYFGKKIGGVTVVTPLLVAQRLL